MRTRKISAFPSDVRISVSLAPLNGLMCGVVVVEGIEDVGHRLARMPFALTVRMAVCFSASDGQFGIPSGIVCTVHRHLVYTLVYNWLSSHIRQVIRAAWQCRHRQLQLMEIPSGFEWQSGMYVRCSSAPFDSLSLNCSLFLLIRRIRRHTGENCLHRHCRVRDSTRVFHRCVSQVQNYSVEWPKLRNIIKYQIDKVRLIACSAQASLDRRWQNVTAFLSEPPPPRKPRIFAKQPLSDGSFKLPPFPPQRLDEQGVNASEIPPVLMSAEQANELKDCIFTQLHQFEEYVSCDASSLLSLKQGFPTVAAHRSPFSVFVNSAYGRGNTTDISANTSVPWRNPCSLHPTIRPSCHPQTCNPNRSWNLFLYRCSPLLRPHRYSPRSRSYMRMHEDQSLAVRHHRRLLWPLHRTRKRRWVWWTSSTILVPGI
jgi:hypothetical protein